MTRGSSHTPVRTCIGCRSKRGQRVMSRVVVGACGCAVVDRTASGRGAWLCTKQCFDRAMKQRGFDRALRRRMSTENVADVRAALPDSVPAGTREER